MLVVLVADVVVVGVPVQVLIVEGEDKTLSRWRLCHLSAPRHETGENAFVNWWVPAIR